MNDLGFALKSVNVCVIQQVERPNFSSHSGKGGSIYAGPI
jgi:hypothetical protein